jgi:hypothetical protein
LKADILKSRLYLLPYIGILLLGIGYRFLTSGLATLDGDSGNYLLPPFIKALTGEWHKGERPMPYLQIIYFTLSASAGLKYTILLQKILGIIGAGFLALAWINFVKQLKENSLIWNIAGYAMLNIFVSAPILMYNELLIGPESISISLMCFLIYCITIIFSSVNNSSRRLTFIAIAIFVNLFLAAIMPKWMFAAMLLEVMLIYWVIKILSIPKRSTMKILAVPHLIYFILIFLPERINKIDSPEEDRLYIEYKQMAYTHFDLLIADKSNFPAPLQDSMVKYFQEAQAAEPNFLIGFSSDELMWGKANEVLDNYFNKNYDSLTCFYRGLNWKLATKYPFGLTWQIMKQLGAFYIPNSRVHKDLYHDPNFHLVYEGTLNMVNRFDSDLIGNLGNRPDDIMNKAPEYFLSPLYPPTLEQAGIRNVRDFPLLFKGGFEFFRWFDFIFLSIMVLNIFILIYKKELMQYNLIVLMYALIFLYALTIAIVHSFDINRFITTIYPFLLISTFMGVAHIGKEILRFILQTEFALKHEKHIRFLK